MLQEHRLQKLWIFRWEEFRGGLRFDVQNPNRFPQKKTEDYR